MTILLPAQTDLTTGDLVAFSFPFSGRGSKTRTRSRRAGSSITTIRSSRRCWPARRASPSPIRRVCRAWVLGAATVAVERAPVRDRSQRREARAMSVMAMEAGRGQPEPETLEREAAVPKQWKAALDRQEDFIDELLGRVMTAPCLLK